VNVIWIISDTLRRDALGVYGNKKIHTPAIDSLAAKSMRFNRHYAAGFPTMPTRADFFTGRWTMSFMQWEPLPASQATLAQLLSAKGIQTAAVVDTPFYVGEGMNYERGFKTFFNIPGQISSRGLGIELRSHWHSEIDRFAPRTFLTATQWLERHYKENFFLCIDTWDPHEAFEAPNYYTELYWPNYDGENIFPPYAHWKDVVGFTEEKVKKALASYWGEVTMVDTWVGYLLRQLENMNLMDKTAIIFTTDHGFYFGEHDGLFGKSVAYLGPDEKLVPINPQNTGPVPEDEVWVPAPYRVKKMGATGPINNARTGGWVDSPLYEEITAIPLLIYMPKVPSGVYNGLTSAIDLMPTVMDLMGQAIPPFVEGHSLIPTIKDPYLPGRKFVVTSEPFANPGERSHIVDGIGRPLIKAPITTVTTDEWTLLYNIEPGLSELYNLKTDPEQDKNLIAQYPEKARELHQLLVKFMRDTKVTEERAKIRLDLRL
jgi:arylsulfatase A-like enzyme